MIQEADDLGNALKEAYRLIYAITGVPKFKESEDK